MIGGQEKAGKGAFSPFLPDFTYLCSSFTIKISLSLAPHSVLPREDVSIGYLFAPSHQHQFILFFLQPREADPLTRVPLISGFPLGTAKGRHQTVSESEKHPICWKFLLPFTAVDPALSPPPWLQLLQPENFLACLGEVSASSLLAGARHALHVCSLILPTPL